MVADLCLVRMRGRYLTITFWMHAARPSAAPFVINLFVDHVVKPKTQRARRTQRIVECDPKKYEPVFVIFGLVLVRLVSRLAVG